MKCQASGCKMRAERQYDVTSLTREWPDIDGVRQEGESLRTITSRWCKPHAREVEVGLLTRQALKPGSIRWQSTEV